MKKCGSCIPHSSCTLIIVYYLFQFGRLYCRLFYIPGIEHVMLPPPCRMREPLGGPDLIGKFFVMINDF